MATATAPGSPTPQRVRWTCDEFHDVSDSGLFEGRNVILVDGELLEMPAPNPPHRMTMATHTGAHRPVNHRKVPVGTGTGDTLALAFRWPKCRLDEAEER